VVGHVGKAGIAVVAIERLEVVGEVRDQQIDEPLFI
jgi:hypothetical protein